MKKIIKLRESDLTKIVKRVILEGEGENHYKEKMVEFISNNGILYVIDFLGGMNNFTKKLPEYFTSVENKLKLIKEIVKEEIEKQEWGDYILYNEITINEELDPETNNEFITSIISMDLNEVKIYVYEYDEEGFMYDEPVDSYYETYEELGEITINKIFGELTVDL
jgi:hypothetical protein